MMRLIRSHERDRWETISRYGEWQAKEAKFRWDPKIKTWWTDDIKKALRLRQYADATLQQQMHQMYAEEQQQKQRSIELSRASRSSIYVPAPDGLTYLPYQLAGIQYALERDATLIGDEMGLGKTISAIGVINATPETESVLVVCPASLKLNWKRELEKWLVKPYIVQVAQKDYFPSFEKNIVAIVNYDVLKKFEAQIKSRVWDVMILDEVHYLKNYKAIRTKQVFGAKDVKPIQCKRKLYLTGTPMVNRPIELFGILKSLNRKEWWNWKQYVERYCDAWHNGYAYDVSGASNLDELQDRLRASCMIRRLKQDVLKDLPAKVRQVVELPMNGASDAVETEKTLNERYQQIVDEKRALVELAKASSSKEQYNDAVRELTAATQLQFTEMSQARKDVALAKVPSVIDRLKDVIDGGNKVVVYAHHHEVIDAIYDALDSGIAVKFDGRTSMNARDWAVREFQENPRIQVFVGGIRAAGVGLTLTASSHVIFAELDWVPGVMSQAEDRCHRIGQHNSVLVQHLVVDESIDAVMAHRLVEKQYVLDQALDVHTDPQKRAERDEQATAAIVHEEQQQTTSASYDQITAEAKLIQRHEIDHWHQGLKMLQAACDKARTKDMTGFSKVDLQIGHALASAESLSNRQGVLARKICKKYTKQLQQYGFDTQYNF